MGEAWKARDTRLGQFSVSTNGVLVYQSGGSRLMQPSWFDRQGRILGRVGTPIDGFSEPGPHVYP
ncbi:MAG: hypothetical protein QUT30_19350 [Acidobacteriota bacterium]|nr:hypothetical protein [Acidobacteriota bacterium]